MIAQWKSQTVVLMMMMMMNNRGADSLSLVSIVASELRLVKFVGTELDGGVGHDPDHGGRVPPPQAEQTFLGVRAVEEPEGLLRRKTATIIESVFCPSFLFLLSYI